MLDVQAGTQRQGSQSRRSQEESSKVESEDARGSREEGKCKDGEERMDNLDGEEKDEAFEEDRKRGIG